MGLYCGKSKPQPILTHGNTAWIKFKSDSVFTSKGFKARFKAYETPKTKCKYNNNNDNSNNSDSAGPAELL